MSLTALAWWLSGAMAQPAMAASAEFSAPAESAVVPAPSSADSEESAAALPHANLNRVQLSRLAMAAGEAGDEVHWLDAEGRLRARIETGRWPHSQYTVRDADGAVLAHGNEPLSWPGPWQRERDLQITDAHGEPLLRILRQATHAHSAIYQVFDPEQRWLASVRVATGQRRLEWNTPSPQARTVATLQPFEQTDGAWRPAPLAGGSTTAVKTWWLSVDDESVIPEAAWPLSAAFFLSEQADCEKRSTLHVLWRALTPLWWPFVAPFWWLTDFAH